MDRTGLLRHRCTTICLWMALACSAGWLTSTLAAQAASSADIAGHAQAAHQFLANKNPEGAIPEFRAVLTGDPNNLDAQANLGVLLYFRNDLAGAEPWLRAAVAQKADLSKLRALLGLTEKALGEPREAQADLQQAVPQLTEAPIRIQAGLALVELDAAAGDMVAAADVLAGVRQLAPTDPRVLYASYRIHTDLAGEALLSLSLAAPESPQMHQATAHELIKARDGAAAIANFRKAAELDPRLPGIHFELAEALRLADDPKDRAEAEAEYRKAVELDPKDARSMAALGDQATEHGDLKAARTWYERALAINASSPEALLGEAYVLAASGDNASAAALLERVVHADPTNATAHFRLSALDRKLGRPDDAKRELAAYQHFKELKERMRSIYKQMREETPDNPSTTAPAAK